MTKLHAEVCWCGSLHTYSRSYGTPKYPKCMTSYHSLSLTNQWHVENGWPNSPHELRMFPFTTGNSWEPYITNGPLDEVGELLSWHRITFVQISLHKIVKRSMKFHEYPVGSNCRFHLWKGATKQPLNWMIGDWSGRALTKKKDCHWHLPFPIQGSVMPASCASIADEATWLGRQMVLNHHGHYVTVNISTCPKVGQSGSMRRFLSKHDE